MQLHREGFMWNIGRRSLPRGGEHEKGPGSFDFDPGIVGLFSPAWGQSRMITQKHFVVCKTISDLNQYCQALKERDYAEVLQMMKDGQCAPLPPDVEVYVIDTVEGGVTTFGPEGKSIPLGAIKIKIADGGRGTFWALSSAVTSEAK